jgi:hypothetical protein
MAPVGQISTTPLYADNLSSIYATFNNGNASLNIRPDLVQLVDEIAGVSMNLGASLINFSDVSGKSELTTTSLNMSTAAGGNLKLSGVNSSFILSTPGTLNFSVGELILNGVPAPAGPGQSLIANDKNGGLQWFTITDLLNLEAGVYTNNSNDTRATIEFGKPYMSAPAVVITPDSDSNGQIIPVSLNGVSTQNFSVVFGSNQLKKFNFVVLPINSTYSINKIRNATGGATINDDTVRTSELNASSLNTFTN